MSNPFLANQEKKTYNRQMKTSIKKLFRNIGEQNITLNDIADLDPDSIGGEVMNPRMRFMLKMMQDGEMNLAQMAVLSDYANAIVSGNTKSMEHIYAMHGEPVTSQVNVNTTTSNLKELSNERIEELLEFIASQRESENDCDCDCDCTCDCADSDTKDIEQE